MGNHIRALFFEHGDVPLQELAVVVLRQNRGFLLLLIPESDKNLEKTVARFEEIRLDFCHLLVREGVDGGRLRLVRRLRVEPKSVVLDEVVHDLNAARCRDVRLQLTNEERLLLLCHGHHFSEDAQDDAVSGMHGFLMNVGGGGIRTRR